jgi:hypothetical protein
LLSFYSIVFLYIVRGLFEENLSRWPRGSVVFVILVSSVHLRGQQAVYSLS